VVVITSAHYFRGTGRKSDGEQAEVITLGAKKKKERKEDRFVKLWSKPPREKKMLQNTGT
jgi:hypothetical protein